MLATAILLCLFNLNLIFTTFSKFSTIELVFELNPVCRAQNTLVVNHSPPEKKYANYEPKQHPVVLCGV